VSVADHGGVLARLRVLKRRVGDLFAHSVGSAARAGRAAGRALVPDPPLASSDVAGRLEALAARLARIEGDAGGAPAGARLGAVERLIRESAALSRGLTGRAGVHPLPALDTTQAVGRVARQVLAALDESAQPSPRVARAVIGLAHPRPEIRKLALEFLGTPPEPVVLPLLEVVYEQASGAERRAILAVARAMETGGRPSTLVREALADGDAAVRLGGVRAVPRGAKLPEELDELAARDPQAEVRRASLQALVGGESTRRGVRVEQGLRDRDARVRLETIHAAATTRDPAVVLPLMRALLDADAEVRGAAAAALGELTGLDPVFDPLAPAAQRREVVSRLRREWGRLRFQPPGAEVASSGAPPLGDDELAQPLDAEYLVEPGASGRRAG
jgi:HEAT repeat protein